MRSNPIKKPVLFLCWLLAPFCTTFSQSDIEEYKISGPLQLIFKDQHDQDKLTPVQKLNRKAVASMGKQDWKTAFGFLMQAMKEDPTSAETFINFGVAHFMREEYPSSEKALLKALEVEPTNAKALYHYSQVMVLKGEKESAMNAATRAVMESEESEWKYLEWLGELKIERLAYQDAADSYSKALTVLQDKVSTVNEAIQREEAKQEVVDTYTDIEIVTDQGGQSREVEVTKFRYDQKEAPEQWHQLKSKLEGYAADLEKRHEEALRLANS